MFERIRVSLYEGVECVGRAPGVGDEPERRHIMIATPSAAGIDPDEHGRSGRTERWLAGTGDGTDLDRHVHVLVLGLPGAGTTTVARLLARES